MHTTGVAKEKKGRAPATEVLTNASLQHQFHLSGLILLGNSLSLRSDIVFCDVWEHGSALVGELSTGLEEEEVPLVGRATEEGQSSKEELKGHMDDVPCADSNVECTDIEGMGLTAEV